MRGQVGLDIIDFRRQHDHPFWQCLDTFKPVGPRRHPTKRLHNRCCEFDRQGGFEHDHRHASPQVLACHLQAIRSMGVDHQAKTGIGIANGAQPIGMGAATTEEPMPLLCLLEIRVKAQIEEAIFRKLPLEQFQWYLDLRRFGSVPHAGFGLGIERTVAWICGLHHVRETIPFARLMDRLTP